MYLLRYGDLSSFFRYHQNAPFLRVYEKRGILLTVVSSACWRILRLMVSVSVTLILNMDA